MAERLMAADCKSAAPCVLRGFESLSAHQPLRGGRARMSSDPQEKSTPAHVSQSVEHVLGKDGVSGSIPLIGSRIVKWQFRRQHDANRGSDGVLALSSCGSGLLSLR